VERYFAKAPLVERNAGTELLSSQVVGARYGSARRRLELLSRVTWHIRIRGLSEWIGRPSVNRDARHEKDGDSMLGQNAILSSLAESDAAALRPHLKTAHLDQKRVLFEAGDTIKYVYFPTTAVISLVVTLSTGETTESAMVGRDGGVGLAPALDGRIALCRAVVQLGGDAMTCDISSFRDVVMRSETLISTVIRYEQAVFSQAQQSTACMANHEVESRLCRWLLRARDLSGSDELAFTQEFLAEMLGVRRTSVTTVAHTLQAAGMVKYTRGKIHIVDVEGLRDTACECYETVRDQYDQLIGPSYPQNKAR
jgi:CRP-like cAMP-binding protein